MHLHKSITVDRVIDMVARDDSEGICVHCGLDADYSVEPDARKVRCSNCGHNRVYGAAELLLLLEIP